MPTVSPECWPSLVEEALRRALTTPDAWKDLVHHTKTERMVADQHEGRYLVELLQNARDAWCAAHGVEAGQVTADRPARALLCVTDRGLLVADQGGGFDLSESEVFDAVRFLSRSSKVDAAGHGKGFAGHKGIGLKAVLRRCQAFAVWSQLPDGRKLAADLRRSQTDRVLARLLAHDPPPPEVMAQVHAERHLLPLFRFPHIADEQVEDESLARFLLGDGDVAPAGLIEALSTTGAKAHPRFHTVVRLDFEDEEWQADTPPLEADTVWSEVVELDPRTVLLLGTFQRVDLVRVKGEGAQARVAASLSVSVKSCSPRATLPGGKVTHRSFDVRALDRHGAPRAGSCRWHLLATSAAEVAGYDAEVEGQAEVCVAIPDLPPHEAYVDLPLFMYYPIQSSDQEAGDGLPILVHGPFRVVPDRTGLDAGQARHNRAVLDAALSVVEVGLPWLSARDDAPQGLPWRLLPSLPAGEGLVAAFRGKLLASVAAAPCLPGSACPADPELLLPVETLGDVDAAQVVADLVGHVLADSLQQLADWARQAWQGDLLRVQALRTNRAAWANAFFDLLESWADEAEVAIAVRREQAAAVSRLAEAATQARSGAEEKDVAVLAVRHLPVLPCEARTDGTETGSGPAEALLVRAAPQQRSGSRFVARPRVVLYQRPGDDDAGGRQLLDALPPPPQVPVHFLLEPEGSWLHPHGRALGLRAHQGDASLLEAILERALPWEDNRLDPESAGRLGGYCALLLARVHAPGGGRPGPWLAWAPLAWIPAKSWLWRPRHSWPEWRAEAERWRLRLLARALPVPCAHGTLRPAGEAWVGPAWAATFAVALDGITAPEVEDRRATGEAVRAALRTLPATHAGPPLAPPSDPRWDSWRLSLAPRGAAAEADLVRLLLFLGVQVTPPLTVGWAWPGCGGGPQESENAAKATLLPQEAKWDATLVGAVEQVDPGVVSAYRHLLAEPTRGPRCDARAHTDKCEGNRARNNNGARLVRQIWLTGPVEQALAWGAQRDKLGEQTPALPDGKAAIDALAASLATGWLDGVLDTGWICHGWHNQRHPTRPSTPSLAGFQVRHGLAFEADAGSDAPPAALLAPTQADRRRHRLAPVWTGRVGAHAVLDPEPLARALAMPTGTKGMDGQQAAAALRRASREVADGFTDNRGRGLLRRMLRALLAPADTERSRDATSVDPGLFKGVSLATALPAVVDARICWVPVDGEPPRLVEAETGRVVVLRDQPTRLEREYARERAELLGTATAGEGELTHYRALAEELGAERVVEADLPATRLGRQPVDASSEPWRSHLHKRLDALAAVLRHDPRVPKDAPERLLAAVEVVTTCRGLHEVVLERAPRAVPSAWDPIEPALLVDIDRVPPEGGAMRHLAWGLSAATGGAPVLGEVFAILDAETSDLHGTLVALGVPTTARTDVSREQMRRSNRRVQLEELVGTPLPAALATQRVLSRGLLDAAAIEALGGQVPNGLSFRPTAADLRLGRPGALRRLAAAAVLARGVATAYEASADAVELVERMLGTSPSLHCGQVLEAGQLGPELAAELVWATDGAPDGVAASIRRIADELAQPETLDALLDPQADSVRAAAKTLEGRRRSRRDRARELRRQRLIQAPPPSMPIVVVTTASAMPSGGGGRGAGPSACQVARGDAGQVAAMGDVLGRLIALHLRPTPDHPTAAQQLAHALALLHAEDGPLPKSVRRTPPDVAKLTGMLDQASALGSSGATAEAAGQSLDDLERLLDVSELRGPGFDLLDPLGALSPRGRPGPVRVELKTTSTALTAGGSLRVRLTVNEARRALEGSSSPLSMPYLLRIYHDSSEHALPALAAEIADPAGRLELLRTAGASDLLDAVRGGHFVLGLDLGPPD